MARQENFYPRTLSLPIEYVEMFLYTANIGISVELTTSQSFRDLEKAKGLRRKVRYIKLFIRNQGTTYVHFPTCFGHFLPNRD